MQHGAARVPLQDQFRTSGVGFITGFLHPTHWRGFQFVIRGHKPNSPQCNTIAINHQDEGVYVRRQLRTSFQQVLLGFPARLPDPLQGGLPVDVRLLRGGHVGVVALTQVLRFPQLQLHAQGLEF